MKGCSRKSSDFVASAASRSTSCTLNERLLPKEQRRASLTGAWLGGQPLNERLLPKEQRPSAIDAYIKGDRPSMKGCSRKSSDVIHAG